MTLEKKLYVIHVCNSPLSVKKICFFFGIWHNHVSNLSDFFVKCVFPAYQKTSHVECVNLDNSSIQGQFRSLIIDSFSRDRLLVIPSHNKSDITNLEILISNTQLSSSLESGVHLSLITEAWNFWEDIPK